MRRKLLVLAIALACLAAPAQLALAADVCSPCCARSADEPCERRDGSCTFLGSADCCQAATCVPVPPVLRLPDAPSAAACPARMPFEAEADRYTSLLRGGDDPTLRVPPRQRSVVLQI